MGDAVFVEGLEKSYGGNHAVAGMTFRVGDGEVVGLLGPNGAGKTTTVEILEGLLRRDAGIVRVLGHDPEKRSRRLSGRLGITPQSGGLDAVLTVEETLRFYASFYRARRRIVDLVEDVGLVPFAHQRIGTLSGGQRRLVDLALALVGDPQVLFLDEPTTGLDPVARRHTWEVLAGLHDRGVAVLLTSHYLDEVQRLADRVIVVRAGLIVADDVPDKIMGQAPPGALITFRMPPGRALPLGPWHHVGTTAEIATLATDDATEAMRVLLGWAEAKGVGLEHLEVRAPSLEDRYLELIEER